MTSSFSSWWSFKLVIMIIMIGNSFWAHGWWWWRWRTCSLGSCLGKGVQPRSSPRFVFYVPANKSRIIPRPRNIGKLKRSFQKLWNWVHLIKSRFVENPKGSQLSIAATLNTSTWYQDNLSEPEWKSTNNKPFACRIWGQWKYFSTILTTLKNMKLFLRALCFDYVMVMVMMMKTMMMWLTWDYS